MSAYCKNKRKYCKKHHQ